MSLYGLWKWSLRSSCHWVFFVQKQPKWCSHWNYWVITVESTISWTVWHFKPAWNPWQSFPSFEASKVSNLLIVVFPVTCYMNVKECISFWGDDHWLGYLDSDGCHLAEGGRSLLPAKLEQMAELPTGAATLRLFPFPWPPPFKSPSLSLPGSPSPVAHSFTFVCVLHEKGKPVTVVPWSKGHLNSSHIFWWVILSLVSGGKSTDSIKGAVTMGRGVNGIMKC